MAILRGELPTNRFTIVPNYAARDSRLSLKAKGLLLYILSHAQGYRLTTEQIIAESTDGRESVHAAQRELIAFGYLRRMQTRDEATQRITGMDYEVDLPVDGFPVPGSDQAEPQVTPTNGFPVYGQPATKKTRSKKTKEEEHPPGDAEASPPAEPSPTEMNAGQIVAGWIDWLRTQQVDLPKQVIGRYAAEIKRQLDQGFGDLLIRKALHQMFKKGVHGRPALLPSFLVETQGFAPRDTAPRSFADQAQDKRERRRIVAQIADRLAESRGWNNDAISANFDALMAEASAVFDTEMAKRSSGLYTGHETWTERPALEVAT